MGSEHKVYLKKDESYEMYVSGSYIMGWCIDDPYSNIPEVTASTVQNINLCWRLQPTSSDTSTIVNAMSDYIQTLKRDNGKDIYASLFSRWIDNNITFGFEINRNFIQRLCNIFPQPYLTVDITMDDIFEKNNGLASLYRAALFPGRERVRQSHPGRSIKKRFDLEGVLAGIEDLGDPGPTVVEFLGLRIPCRRFETSIVYSISLGWSNIDTSSIQMGTDTFTKNLFTKHSSKDWTLVAGNGAEIKCHRLILEASSAVFSAMMLSTNGMRESQTGRIDMRQNTEECIRCLVQYLYGLGLPIDKVSCEVAVELLQMAHMYELPELASLLAKTIKGKPNDWFTPDGTVALYLFVKNLDEFSELYEYSQCIMLSSYQEIKTCDRFKELNRMDALDLVWKLFELK